MSPHRHDPPRAAPRAIDRRRVLGTIGALGALGAGLVARTAEASSSGAFPERPVRIVVPYSVGVGPDVVARALSDALARRWSRPLVIENRPGASGIVAFGEVRRTAPDGHTLFLADTATLVVNPLLHASLPYDPERDLAPLTLLFRATFVVWVGGDSRFRGVAELLDAARRAPGRVSYGSLGHGHASQVAIETLARAAGVRLLHVPFTEAGALFTAVASGAVDFTAFSVNSVAGLMAAGRLRPLAVAAAERLPALPELPTLAEAGAPPVEMRPWAALVTLAGTPPPLLARLRDDLKGALASDDVRRRTEQAGFELTPSTAQAVLARMDADRALVASLMSEGRIVAG